jgi:hypothetical protein
LQAQWGSFPGTDTNGKRQEHRMDSIMQAIEQYIRNFDWNSPEAFGVTAGIAALLFQRWMILFTVVIIMVLGATIVDYAAFEFTFNNYTVTAPFTVYLVGAVVVAVLAFQSLFSR